MLSSRAWPALLAVFAAVGAVAQPPESATPPPPSPASAETVAAAAPLWPAIDTDLPADPALIRGELPNGLRYAVLPNAEPKDRISLRLLVRVGSLHENDDELGLAHFVEHMAFRGTRAFPDGSMTAALQRLGVGLGPDSTAFTSLDHTIYHLELPDAREATLREGLRVFREYAGAVTFDEKLIDRERGVVLSEMAVRDTPDARAAEANLAFLWPKARENQRRTIGDPALLRRFTREQFVAFYDAWYRPERMAVIIVGAVEAAAAERLVAEYFADFQARAVARADPPDLITREAGSPNVGVFTDPGLIGIGVSLEHPIFAPREDSTAAQRERNVHQGLAFAMLRNRLQRVGSDPGSSIVSPAVVLTRVRPTWNLVAIGVSGRIDDWRRLAAELEQEHRRAFLHGFTARELAEARGAFAMQYEQMARSAGTRPSTLLTQQLVGLLLYGGTFATPEVLRQDVQAFLASATPRKCHEAFRTAWTAGAPSVFVSANPLFNITRQQIAAVLNESRKTPVTAPAEAAAPTFAYQDFGPASQPVKVEHVPDLDVRLSRFANGVAFNFKSTPFDADTVEIRVRFGNGKLSQPVAQPGLDLLANTAFVTGGLGRHRAQELDEILSSHALRLSFQVLPDACGFHVYCAPREVDLALRVITAFLTDAGFRPEALRGAVAQINSMYASLNASPGGPLTVFALREVLAGDTRFGTPTIQEANARTLPEVEAWLRPQLLSGAVEISMVGDLSWEDAVAAVGKTFGALPARGVLREQAPRPALKFAPPHPSGIEKAFPISGGLRQSALAWYWPVPKLSGHQEERRCHLLAQILMDRLRLKLRDEIGATYSPSVGFVYTEGFSNLNYFTFYAEVDPAKKPEAWKIVEREVTALGKTAPTPDEFERARQPYLSNITEHLRTNSYWGGTVLSDAQLRPKRLIAARDRTADNAAITREEIQALARKHLAPNRAFRFATLPVIFVNTPPGTRQAPAPGTPKQ